MRSPEVQAAFDAAMAKAHGVYLVDAKNYQAAAITVARYALVLEAKCQDQEREINRLEAQLRGQPLQDQFAHIRIGYPTERADAEEDRVRKLTEAAVGGPPSEKPKTWQEILSQEILSDAWGPILERCKSEEQRYRVIRGIEDPPAATEVRDAD